MDYSGYKDLQIRQIEPGILEIVMGEEGKLAVATARAHAEMARVWLDVEEPPPGRLDDARRLYDWAAADGYGPAIAAIARLSRPSRVKLETVIVSVPPTRVGAVRPAGAPARRRCG